MIQDLVYEGKINNTCYILIFSQAISKNVTTLRFINEVIDQDFNYYISIPLTFDVCPGGFIYVFYETG